MLECTRKNCKHTTSTNIEGHICPKCQAGILRPPGFLFREVPTFNLEQFTREAGDTFRDKGMKAVTASKASKLFVQQMRQYAIDFAREHGTVTAADIRRHSDKIGYAPHHANVFGNIFKSNKFRCVGYEQSSTTSRRGGLNRIWELV